ncbi:hypothetical protein [Streptomyces sp. NPDC008122]|uniref:hypothetical protein n=1 Tax=Streptomyces sp. NPDC008122 TaxID=3364810 RepID=UPI0036E2DB96
MTVTTATPTPPAPTPPHPVLPERRVGGAFHVFSTLNAANMRGWMLLAVGAYRARGSARCVRRRWPWRRRCRWAY